MKLSTLLTLNTRTAKHGSGCDAPRWWQEGKHAQLERYCAQDVRALAELVLRANVRVPGGGATDGMSLQRVLRDVCDVDAKEEREPQSVGQKRQRATAGLDPARATACSDAADGDGERAPQRRRGEDGGSTGGGA